MRIWLGLALVAGCSGDKTSDTGGSTTGETGTTGTTGTTGASFNDVYFSVLKPTCELAGCHAVGSGNGMELSDSGAYDAMVNAPALAAPGETIVIPGDSANSYVMKKLLGSPGIVGTQMPPTFGTGISADEIDQIRAWIDAGANP